MTLLFSAIALDLAIAPGSRDDAAAGDLESIGCGVVGPSNEPTTQCPEQLDAELVQQALAGKGGAWASLYERHFRRLFRHLMFMVNDPATAEDLAQETFAIALVSLRHFDHRSSVAGWLRGIGQNLARKHWRTRARRGRACARIRDSAPAIDPRAAEDPETTHLQKQRAQVLNAVIDALPASLREVFVMRDVQGLSASEVAERLQISPGNVRVRANRARARIRQELEKLGWLERSEV